MGNNTDSPTLGVGVAIIEDGKILLTKRRDFPVWCLPGGHLSPGESFLDAAVREAKEETGLEIELINLVGVYSMPDKWENGSCEIILRAKVIGGELLHSTNETVQSGFYSLDELPTDLVGWQFHQAFDALCDVEGNFVVLDTKVSISQFRDVAKKIEDSEDRSSFDFSKEICKRPGRIDLTLH